MKDRVEREEGGGVEGETEIWKKGESEGDIGVYTGFY